MTELPTIHEIRLHNTRELLRDSGLNRTKFSEKIGISYNLLSQYIGRNPTKNIGDETANKIEKGFLKPKGYLDQSIELLSKKSIETSIAIALTGRTVLVKAHSKMDVNGYFYDKKLNSNVSNGYVPSLAAGKYSYAIKGTGDSMFPAIRNGWFLVCDPEAIPEPTEFIEVQLKDGRRTINEFLGIINNVLHVLAVNGSTRLTFDMAEVENIVAIVEIIPPSRYIQELPIMT